MCHAKKKQKKKAACHIPLAVLKLLPDFKRAIQYKRHWDYADAVPTRVHLN